MLRFLQENWGSIVALAVVALALTAAVVKIIRDKKRGVCSSCGERCESCDLCRDHKKGTSESFIKKH
ncbi:MAG: FeoB-associated Cys-rich membrane protein [Clostridia bacterium]|nr:FeoB-associated Cys-rich membrane protein [Clostridia bacterium]